MVIESDSRLKLLDDGVCHDTVLADDDVVWKVLAKFLLLFSVILAGEVDPAARLGRSEQTLNLRLSETCFDSTHSNNQLCWGELLLENDQ